MKKIEKIRILSNRYGTGLTDTKLSVEGGELALANKLNELIDAINELSEALNKK